MDISVLILGFNEEENLPKLFEPLKGITDIVFLDHQSTDNTAKLAGSLGARVYTREFPADIVTERDVREFSKRFGYIPQFKEGDHIANAGKERALGGDLCKNDWILNIDCDEVVTWDIDKVKEKMKDVDVVNCRFNHTHHPDGTPDQWFQVSKLYNRQKTWWLGRVHEVKTGYDLRVGWTDDMIIDHWQKPKEIRRLYINYLEYAVTVDGDLRSFFYLGKEYFTYGYYEKAIKLLSLYLKEATYEHEIVKTYIMLATSFLYLGKEEEAWIFGTQALKVDPTSKETYMLLSQIAKPKHRATWMEHANIAVDQHFL